MCGHIFLGYHGQRSLQASKALWRCSACGRQSHMPLDCCERPDYHSSRPSGMVYTSVKWLGSVTQHLHMRLQSWLVRQPHTRSDVILAEPPSTVEPEWVREPVTADLDSDVAMGIRSEEWTEKMDDVRELQLR